LGAGTVRFFSPVFALVFVFLIFCITLTGCGLGGATTATTTGSQPVLSLSQTTVVFGSVNTGAGVNQALMLRNTGTASLTVSAIAVSGTGFSVSGFTLPLTIAAGSNFAGTIRFAPTKSGSVTGSVTITSNSTTSAPPIALSGTGVAPTTPTSQLTLSPTSFAFGNITAGQTSSKQLTLRNSGTADLHVTALAVVGAGYSTNGFGLPLTLTPGTSSTGNVVFTPTSAGAVNGSLTFTSDSASAAPPVALSATGVTATPLISVTPNSMLFGNVMIGQSATTPLTLKNTGTASLSVTAITPSGAGYSVNGFILPLTLAPNATAVGNVVFAPTTSASIAGTIKVTSNSSTAAPTVSLSGTGVAQLTFLLNLSASSLNFGPIDLGTTGSQNVSLTNTGTGSVSVTSATVTGTGYSVPATFPFTIAAGASRSIAITFTPALTGLANGTIAFVSNATNSPATLTITGTGQTPVPHSVDITWNPSTSSVIGYLVYRSTISGGPYTQLNASSVANTAFTDSTVLAHTTYFYVIRAVDASGVESPNSAQVSAVIP
jgi:hypothetical protein